MTNEEIRDWYEGSTCVGCGKEDCFGDCPEYAAYEANMVGVEIDIPTIPCCGEDEP